MTNLETSTATETRFVYDGWNLIAELNSSLIPTKLFYWGLDLSGSIHGAGGVGGLLLIKIPGTATHCVAMDGNGNVAGTIYCGTTSAGQTSAAYEYGPFGELLRATGSLAALNSFRFSTKYQDTESDSIRFRWQQANKANDCCCHQVLINFMASDTLRVGSNPRIPKTTIEIVPDNFFGKNGPLHNVDLEWNWSEVISY